MRYEMQTMPWRIEWSAEGVLLSAMLEAPPEITIPEAQQEEVVRVQSGVSKNGDTPTHQRETKKDSAHPRW